MRMGDKKDGEEGNRVGGEEVKQMKGKRGKGMKGRGEGEEEGKEKKDEGEGIRRGNWRWRVLKGNKSRKPTELRTPHPSNMFQGIIKFFFDCSMMTQMMSESPSIPN